ncbi:hypothetical protein [Bradyrhizobium sp. STM 3809]|nr:hypothetical protein [Bradyrhizobium sp. STM 3809]
MVTQSGIDELSIAAFVDAVRVSAAIGMFWQAEREVLTETLWRTIRE